MSRLGDLISNISTVSDWELSNKEKGEKIDFFAKNIALNSSINVLLYNYMNGLYNDIHSKKFLKDLFNGLVMSAVSMIVVKSSRPASGREHNTSHALDRLGSKEIHSLQVGFSTLLTLYLHKKFDILQDLMNLYKYFEFPTSFYQLKFSEEDFIKVLKTVSTIGDRYTILNEFSLDKFQELQKRL